MGAWFLVVVISLYTGTDKVVSIPMPDETACFIEQAKARSLNEYGLHIKAVGCVVGGKEA